MIKKTVYLPVEDKTNFALSQKSDFIFDYFFTTNQNLEKKENQIVLDESLFRKIIGDAYDKNTEATNVSHEVRHQWKQQYIDNLLK